MRLFRRVLKPALPGLAILTLTGCACCVIPDLPPDPRLADYRIEGARLVQGGYAYQYQLMTEWCCPPQPTAVQEPVRWSIWPYAEGMNLDFERGYLELAKPLPDNYEGTLTAHVKDIGDVEITLQNRALHPLRGRWRQVGEIECGSGREYIVSAIGELQLSRSHFAVTWQPFESYQDFWGGVSVDDVTGTIRFTVEGSNAAPDREEYRGRYRIDENGRLVLQDMSFNRRGYSSQSCGQVFRLSYPDAGMPLDKKGPDATGLQPGTDGARPNETGSIDIDLLDELETSYYMTAGEMQELKIGRLDTDQASPCELIATVADPAPWPIRYDLQSSDVSISTDFWGAGQDWSVTISEGGETGRHLSLLFRSEELRQAIISNLRKQLHECQAVSKVASGDHSSGVVPDPGLESSVMNSAACHLTFTYDRDVTVFSDPAIGTIEQAAEGILRSAATRVEIRGHTNHVGTQEYNFALATRRATAASEILAHSGVDPAIISIVPYGEDQPRVAPDQPHAADLNSRVEILYGDCLAGSSG